MTPAKPPTRDHVILAQDVEGFLILLDHMALAGPEPQKKMLLETAKRLKARVQDVLHPVRNRRKQQNPSFIDNVPDTTTTAD